jgi:hypothetical protein
MLLERPDPTQVILQIAAHNNDGTPKTQMQEAQVRVYHIASGSEVEDLAWTDLDQVGTTNVWRYIWEPTALPIGQYFVQYRLLDLANAEFLGIEDLCVQDLAVQADVEFFKKLAQGRWKIDTATNRMVFYDENGTTPLAQFLLKDINGLPTSINVFERVPV